MKITFDEAIFSDLHKEAYGFRPRGSRFYDPDATAEEKQKIWDSVLDAQRREVAQEQEREAASIKEFETRITKVIGFGAKDRETAIRWILQGTIEDWQDSGMACYLMGIPYRYQLEFDAVRSAS